MWSIIANKGFGMRRVIRPEAGEERISVLRLESGSKFGYQPHFSSSSLKTSPNPKLEKNPQGFFDLKEGLHATSPTAQ